MEALFCQCDENIFIYCLYFLNILYFLLLIDVAFLYVFVWFIDTNNKVKEIAKVSKDKINFANSACHVDCL